MNKATRKRLLGVLVILCVSLSLVSCTAAPAEDSVSVGDNEFRLSSLPELEPFEPFTEISSRYYDEYTGAADSCRQLWASLSLPRTSCA